jgi:hypothetical protein
MNQALYAHMNNKTKMKKKKKRNAGQKKPIYLMTRTQKELASHSPFRGHSPNALKASHKTSPLKDSTTSQYCHLGTKRLKHGPMGIVQHQNHSTSKGYINKLV